jgi:hypothetical protein
LRFFEAQGQDVADQRRVVKARGVAVGLVGGARDVGAVQTLAQAAVVGELHHRQVAGQLERELVARLAVGFGGGAGGGLHVGRQAVHFGLAGAVGPGVGGVQRVLAELLAQLGQAFLDLGVARLGRALQLGAAQHEVAQRVATRAPLLVVQAGRVDGLVARVQALVAAHAGPELGHPRQGGVVGGAQRGRVHHGVQVADHAPGAAQAFAGHVQRARQRGPVGRRVGTHGGFQRRLGVGQQLVNGGGHVFGADLVEQRQVGKVEEGVVGKAHAPPF